MADASTFFLRLWTSAHRGERVVARELARERAEVPQLAMLLLVALHEPASTTQLAEAIGVPFMTASDALSRLTDAGLAARAPNPRDRRSHLFSLTDTGRGRLAATRAPMERALARLAATGADADALGAAVEALNEALGEALRESE
jgi:MarR family transcriptional regulator, lower aerobic nicotinate degradation pathway regulator